MAVLVLTDTRLFLAGYDLSGRTNQVALEASAEEKDATTFGSGGWRERKGGLRSVQLAANGLLSIATGDVEETLFAAVEVATTALTVAPTAADGEIAYFFQATEAQYSHQATVGELVSWETTAMGRSGSGLVRGQILHPGATARTASGNGTGRQLGDVAGAEKLYAALHVLSVAGTVTPTLTVKVQSDDNSGFSSPTDRVTFTAATAIGAQWAVPVPATITDTWWRVTWTISGTNPSFLFAAAVGIQ